MVVSLYSPVSCFSLFFFACLVQQLYWIHSPRFASSQSLRGVSLLRCTTACLTSPLSSGAIPSACKRYWTNIQDACIALICPGLGVFCLVGFRFSYNVVTARNNPNRVRISANCGLTEGVQKSQVLRGSSRV